MGFSQYTLIMKAKHHAYRLTVVVEKDEDGLYVAICPVLQGCYTQGRTVKEAMKNIRDAIKLNIESRMILFSSALSS